MDACQQSKVARETVMLSNYPSWRVVAVKSQSLCNTGAMPAVQQATKIIRIRLIIGIGLRKRLPCPLQLPETLRTCCTTSACRAKLRLCYARRSQRSRCSCSLGYNVTTQRNAQGLDQQGARCNVELRRGPAKRASITAFNTHCVAGKL